MWIAAFALFFSPERRSVLPSIATTSSGAPISAATQSTKQRWKRYGAVEDGENIAEVIVRGRASGETARTERKNSIFFLAKPRNVDEALRAGQNRKQA